MNKKDVVFITEKINGEMVLRNIDWGSTARSITVPEGVLHIGSHLFGCCWELDEIILPEGLRSIGEEAFYRSVADRELTKVNLPDSIVEIGERAFRECKALKNVKLPENLKILGRQAFYRCNAITEITLPHALKKFNAAFEECTDLKRVTVKKGIKSIDWYAFKDCKSLTEVNLPEGLEEIGFKAFEGCVSLRQIVIPDSVIKIDSGAFSGCVNLESVTIPKGLKEFGKDVFEGCENLRPIVLPEDLAKKLAPKIPEYIEKGKDKALFKLCNENLTVSGVKKAEAHYGILYIPDGVRTVRSYAFSEISVECVVLPEGVEDIQTGAFKGCSRLKRIYIPASVKVIGNDAFCGCKELEIYCEGELREGWLDKEETRKVYWDDMTEAFNFHRSSGSFDERHILERVEVTHNNYNPEKRPVHINVSRKQFHELSEK